MGAANGDFVTSVNGWVHKPLRVELADGGRRHGGSDSGVAMHSDQPINAELVTTVLRTGMWIREWGDRGEMVTAAKIKEAITRLMTGEEGKEVTRRAREIGQKLRAAVEDGGCSKDDLDGFIARVWRP
ncbi:hypothetical protein HPP92_004636 [Vanilla planifolia]|uniref:Uncharacterized protein n=2 Tax=Vanilla planifolia TaxID=51239 RepID=A0A835VCG7_VANPL|nr:hypothetical protein HPP92_004636 [Vanilla planifolia]